MSNNLNEMLHGLQAVNVVVGIGLGALGLIGLGLIALGFALMRRGN